MPDLAGKTLRQALAALAPLRVEVEMQGQRRVVRARRPAPGRGDRRLARRRRLRSITRRAATARRGEMT